MFTVLSNTRNSNLYLIVALAIIVVALLAFAVAPSIMVRGPSINPVTGSQQAYAEFLRGEKAIYASPLGVSEALSAHQVGEKAVYANTVDSSGALSAWRSGEKAIVRSDSLEAALLTYRMGEKGPK